MPDSVAGRLLGGLVLSLGIGLYARRRGSLSNSGVLGAVLVGTLVFGLGGWVRAALVVAFFASSTLLSHLGERRKARFAEKFAKGSRRDLWQTLANGGAATALAVVIGLVGNAHPAYPALAFAFYGALATANADTWATELGVLARRPPRLISTGAVVEPGTSGGVTLAGTGAALAGGLFIGLVGFILTQGAALLTMGALLPGEWILLPVAAAGGLAGSYFDSYLGATVQAIYYCPRCGTETESEIHRCGQRTRQVRGWPWLDNDGVNFLATLFGAIVASLLGRLLM